MMGQFRSDSKFKFLILTTTMIGFVFGYQFYNIDDYVCCNGQLHNRTNGSLDFDCYGSNLCNFRTQRCCGNQAINIEDAEDYRCCRTESYRNDVFFNYRTQICCNGEVIDLPDRDSNTSEILYYCCENQVYNPQINACCSGKIIAKEDEIDCCRDETFNTSTHMCCTEHRWTNASVSSATIVPIDPHRPFCCGLQLYNYEKEICCKNKAWRYPKGYNKKYDRARCCGNQLLYDHRRYLCCGEKVVRKHDSNVHFCCGERLYNYRNQTCCGNRVFNIPPMKHVKCCRNSGKLYDERVQVCCDGKVVANITDEDMFENRIHCC